MKLLAILAGVLVLELQCNNYGRHCISNIFATKAPTPVTGRSAVPLWPLCRP